MVEAFERISSLLRVECELMDSFEELENRLMEGHDGNMDNIITPA